MAISTFDQYQLLDVWRDLTLENIWHFNQITGAAALLAEDPVYVQPDRDIVARALTDAYLKMWTYLGFPPTPTWVYEDIALGDGVHIARQDLVLSNGYLRAVGRRATSLIEADATVSYSDVGGLGVDDTATITVTTDVAADEIGVFFRVADGATGAASQYFRIVPVTVTTSGGTATITGHRALFVKPNGVWAQPYTDPNYLDRNSGNTANASDFVTQVDVYRVYTDDTNAVTLVGDALYTDCSPDCGDDTCTACARIENPDLGIIRVQNTVDCCIMPERVRVYYKAGYPLLNGQIAPEMRTALVRLANTMMPRQPNPTRNPNYDTWARDRDPAETIQQRNVNNPFGVLNGQVAAWQVVEQYALGRAVQLPTHRRGGLWR